MKIIVSSFCLVVSSAILTGCGGGGNVPAPVTEQEVTASVAADAKSNVLGLVESLRQMQKDKEPTTEFCAEMLPTFEGYAAAEGDPNHEIYARLLEAWKSLSSGEASKDALANVESIANELPGQ